MSSCFGCVSESKKEPPKKSTTKLEDNAKFEIDVKIAEEGPKDFGTCPVCGVWVDTLLH